MEDHPTTPFLGEAELAQPTHSAGGKWRRYGLATSGVAVLLLVACFSGYEVGISTESSSKSNDSRSAYSSTGTTATTVLDKKLLAISTTSEYDQPSSLKHYVWLENKVLAEPHRTMTFTAGGALVDFYTSGQAGNSSLTISWGVNGPKVYEGPSMQYTFTSVGEHTIAMHAERDGISSYRTQIDVIVKYVRREFRSIKDAELKEFMGAARTLWDVSTEEGQKTYGENYVGMDFISSWHTMQSAGSVFCDHMHEGTGFLPKHVALSVAFEKSVQAINPKLSVPYWDFTIEGQDIQDNYDGDGTVIKDSSPFFQSDYFGKVNETLRYATEGVWAFAPIDDGAWNRVHNSYGIMRAPWNNNKIPYVTRAMSEVCGYYTDKTIPACVHHADLVQLTALQSFLYASAGVGHGPMHVHSGGVFGKCETVFSNLESKYQDQLDDKIKFTEAGKTHSITVGDMIEKIVQEYFHIYRTLWRSQTCAVDAKPMALQCPDYCSMDTPAADCECTCRGLSDGTFDYQNLIPCMSTNNNTLNLFKAAPVEFQTDFITAMCESAGNIGDNLESSSPVDIVFHVIHPTVERLVHWKLLNGDFEDTSWTSYSYYHGCTGHGPDDIIGMITPVLPGGKTSCSNMEMYEYINPNKGTADYIFETFEWDHCSNTVYGSDLLGTA